MRAFGGNTGSSRLVGTAVVCVAQFVVVLDATIVATALPAIRAALDFAVADLHWVITGYTLAFGGFLITGGRVADLVGPRTVFVAGLGLFVTASVLCALAWSPATIAVARVLQGLGSAVLSPAALALLTTLNEPGPSRRRAIGWWTAAAATGGASGWVLGGVLTEFLGWRFVFWVNLPVCLAAMAVALRTLPTAARDRASGLDLAGSVVATAGLGLLVYGLAEVGQEGALATSSWALVVAPALFCYLAWHEGRTTDPLLPRAFVRCRAIVTANLTALLLTATTTPAMFLSILYAQQVLGLSPVRASLLFPVFNVAVIVGSLGGPLLLGRIGARLSLVIGFAGIGGGAVLLALLPADGAAVGQLLVAFTLMGLGLGEASVTSTHTGTEAAEPAHQGVSAGVLNSSAQVGTALGLAVVTPLATSGGSPAMDGLRIGFVTACLIAGAGVALSLFAPRRPGSSSRVDRAYKMPVSHCRTGISGANRAGTEPAPASRAALDRSEPGAGLECRHG